MMLANPIGLAVFALGVLLVGVAISFSIVVVLERVDMIPRQHRGRWILIVSPLVLVLVGILGWVFI